MPHHRYQRPNKRIDDRLPLDTICTILTRQSTARQGEQHLFSAEKNPDELVREAQRLGFAADRISLLDWDMGIGAYNTTIEERPALHHWLTELLPSGSSRVVLVSQEDRLFRDRTEIQVNRFIEQVVQYAGWVICGARVYNFQREMDREQFRMVCKYGRQYIEFHIKGRLHPATQRAAMRGRHVGSVVPWGYLVDYDEGSPTYKRLLRYEPHAVLLVNEVFRFFANMAYPTLRGVARHWAADRLVWPFFPPGVNVRGLRMVETHAQRDEQLGGYRYTVRMVGHTLTNVAYLGWRVRAGELAWDSQKDAPLLAHEPLVDPDLFWWCYDRVEDERPIWAPSKAQGFVSRKFRPSPRKLSPPRSVPFLLHGVLRCVQHGWHYSSMADRTRTECSAYGTKLPETDLGCPFPSIAVLDEAAVRVFVNRLQFDERDIAALARVAHERDAGQAEEVTRVQRQLHEQRAAYERAKQTILLAPDLRDDFLEALRRTKQTVQELETRLATVQQETGISGQAWERARRVVRLAERIRATFHRWEREFQSKVIRLALEDAVVGRVSKSVIGLALTWRGGAVDCCEMVGQEHIQWTQEEQAALQRYYAVLTWEALCQMLPGRTRKAIDRQARKQGLVRSRAVKEVTVPPLVVALPETVNQMADYGFPLPTSTLLMKDGLFLVPSPSSL